MVPDPRAVEEGRKIACTFESETSLSHDMRPYFKTKQIETQTETTQRSEV